LFAANTVTLAVLIPTANSSRSIRASVGAVSLAVNDVNNASSSLLHGKRLEYIIKEVACDSSDAMAKISLAMEEKKIAAVIGPDCSLACESTAYFTAGRKTVQISYACNSPLLSDKAKYPMVNLPRPTRMLTHPILVRIDCVHTHS
jgi:ABC-type branched-subunit amino acid transport system substrate-binding protein